MAREEPQKTSVKTTAHSTILALQTEKPVAASSVKPDAKTYKELVHQIKQEAKEPSSPVNLHRKINTAQTVTTQAKAAAIDPKTVLAAITRLAEREHFTSIIKRLTQLEKILEQKISKIEAIERMPGERVSVELKSELTNLIDSAARLRAMQAAMLSDLEEMIRKNILPESLEENTKEDEEIYSFDSRGSRRRTAGRKTRKGTLTEDSILQKSKRAEKIRMAKQRKTSGGNDPLEIGGTKLGAATKGAAKKLNSRGPSLELFNAFQGEGKARLLSEKSSKKKII